MKPLLLLEIKAYDANIPNSTSNKTVRCGKDAKPCGKPEAS